MTPAYVRKVPDMRKLILLLTVVMVALAGCASGTGSGSPGGSNPTAQGTNVAFVYVSPLKGSLWTQAWDKARKTIEADGAKTSTVEPIAETADSVGVFENLIAKGNKLIFATAFGYQPFVQQVALAHPDVKFVVIGPWVQKTERPGNVTAISPDNWIARYALGVLAAKTTKTKTLGFVAANPIPTVIASINAYELGARSVDPTIKTKVVFTGVWFDPPRATQAAESLASAGADVIAQYEDSTGTILGAQKAGVAGIGSEADASSLAGNAYLSGSVNHWDEFAAQTLKAVNDGTFKGSDEVATIASGGVTLGTFASTVPSDVKSAVEATLTKLGSGAIVPFTGPISDNTGKVVLPKGESWKDSLTVFARQNFLVEGVVGEIPS